jgi:hypothetical protein
MGVIDLGFHIEKCVLNFIKEVYFSMSLALILKSDFHGRLVFFWGVYKMAAGGLKCYLAKRGVVTSGFV